MAATASTAPAHAIRFLIVNISTLPIVYKVNGRFMAPEQNQTASATTDASHRQTIDAVPVLTTKPRPPRGEAGSSAARQACRKPVACRGIMCP